MRRLLFSTAAMWPALLGSMAAAADAKALDGLDAFVNATMAEWQVPGLALAVVRDGETIHRAGYGVRDLDSRSPVTAKTLFAIGSITKSVTVVGLGLLADEGKLDWDRPVREYLPEFRLKDGAADREVTVRDLVTHRTGLPRHDLVWYRSSLSREELVAALRHLEPNKPLRSAWQYNNLMYVAAGVVTERLSQRSWEDFTRDAILRPLGMDAADFSVEAMVRVEDHARPYGKIDGEVRPVPFATIDALGPAGSINADIEAMARYLRFHIEKGTLGETRLLAEATAAQMQTPQMVLPGDALGPLHKPDADLGTLAYGLGFFLTTYRGRDVVWHSGSIDGYSALLAFLPREKVGAVVLCNLSGHRPTPVCVVRNVFDRLLGLEPIDWVARAKELDRQAERDAADAKAKSAAERKPDAKPAHPWADYAGTFAHPAYGTIRIQAGSEGLTLLWRGANARLKPRHFEHFDTEGDDNDDAIPKTRVSFVTNPKGEVERLTMPLESRVDDIAFVRRDDAPKDADVQKAAAVAGPVDVLILGGKVVDGSGNPWFLGDLAIRGDRIERIAPAGLLKDVQAKRTIDAKGFVVAPGFIDIQGHSREQLLNGDGRVIGKITQGVTTEILGEGTSNAPSKAFDGPRGFDAWLKAMQRHGGSINFGSFLGSASVREYVKGMAQGPPTAAELERMKAIVREAMKDGAFGLASALIYPPDNYVATGVLIALSKEMAPSGGVYITHMRSEGDRLLDAIDEALTIGRDGGVPVEIYHLKAAGRRNWSKAREAIAKIAAARADGQDVGADMYPYTAGGTGLTACLPPWAAAEGKLFENLADPEMRAKIRAEVEHPTSDWENLGELATPEGVLVLGLKKDANQKYAGKRLAEIAADMSKDWIDAAMDLILAERQRVDTIYFLMDEANVAEQLRQPWIKVGTDASGHDPDNAKGLVHPRSYGTYPRILGKYVRDEKVLPLEEAVRKMTSAVAARLSIPDRGLLREGFQADVVLFDPATIIDRATYEQPHQLSTGVRDVFVNGVAVVRDGQPTGAKPGRIVRGPGYRPPAGR